MPVISVVSTKGGVGKTTLASAIAVRASHNSKRVAIVDLDPLGSLAQWWGRRKRVKAEDPPVIFTGADSASSAVEALMLNGWDWIIIDTPPAFVATIEDAIENADLVVIPIRPSSLDLLGSEDAVAMTTSLEKPYLCVINDAEPAWKTTNAAKDYLLAAGIPVANSIIAHRACYLGAMTMGKTGPEIDKPNREGKRQAVDEVEQLWIEIQQMLAFPKQRTAWVGAAKGAAQ